jgi:hypothetical protein
VSRSILWRTVAVYPPNETDNALWSGHGGRRCIRAVCPSTTLWVSVVAHVWGWRWIPTSGTSSSARAASALMSLLFVLFVCCSSLPALQRHCHSRTFVLVCVAGWRWWVWRWRWRRRLWRRGAVWGGRRWWWRWRWPRVWACIIRVGAGRVAGRQHSRRDNGVMSTSPTPL